MKSDEFVVSFLKNKAETRNVPSDLRTRLPNNPYQDVLDDLRVLKVTEHVIASKNFDDLKKALKTANYLYIGNRMISCNEVIKLIETLLNLNLQRNMMRVHHMLRIALPIEYGIRSKCYELLYEL